MIDLSDIDPELHEGLLALAADMRAHGYRSDEPVREIFGLLGDRWSTLILLVLKVGSFRHADLRRALSRLAAEEKISQRVMTLKLRTLERDGLVLRHTTDDVPPKVRYELSDLGWALVGETDRLMAWVQGAQPAICAARAAFDAKRADML